MIYDFAIVDPRELKAQLRQSIKDRLAKMSPKDRAAESRSLCRRILEALPKKPVTLCVYYPLTDEADIRPAIREMFSLGHAVFLPVMENNLLTFRKATSLEELKPGALNIPEPPEEAPLLDPQELDIVLVPGRAFDREGDRIGRGNGGYDIWIAKQRKANTKTQFWGIALECQIVNDIPMEAHDQRLDAVLTARGKV